MQWKEHYHRMFLNYGVFLGNSLIAVKYNVGNFFPRNRTNPSFLYIAPPYLSTHKVFWSDQLF